KQRKLEKQAGDNRKNSVLNDLEMDLKKVQEKNESISKKLEQLNLRMTILSQRNADSMVFLKEIQNLVKGAVGSVSLASNEEKGVEKEDKDKDKDKDNHNRINNGGGENKDMIMTPEQHPLVSVASTSPIHRYVDTQGNFKSNSELTSTLSATTLSSALTTINASTNTITNANANTNTNANVNVNIIPTSSSSVITATTTTTSNAIPSAVALSPEVNAYKQSAVDQSKNNKNVGAANSNASNSKLK
ncbi:ankyrin repeat-containing protein, partial [Reticulomyxa filosa]